MGLGHIHTRGSSCTIRIPKLPSFGDITQTLWHDLQGNLIWAGRGGP